MKWYGYVAGDTAAETPSELEEAAVLADPATLRALARFFVHVADEMDKHGEKFGHEHFEDFFPAAEGQCRVVVQRE